MDNARKNHLSSQHGVALITVLIVSFASVALIGGVFYMLRSGIKTATIHKQFSTAQEAAAGGIEHGATLVKKALSFGGDLPDDLRKGLGNPSTSEIDNLYHCNPQEVPITLRTAGDVSTERGRFDIRLTVQCLTATLIPGSESLIFPPPAGGTGGNPSYYVFYRIRAIAKDETTGQIADVEAVYRVAL